MALLNSNAVKGVCPLCGKAHMACKGEGATPALAAADFLEKIMDENKLERFADDKGNIFSVTKKQAEARGFKPFKAGAVQDEGESAPMQAENKARQTPAKK